MAGPDKSPYKARQVVFSTTPMGEVGTAGVTVSKITEDNTPVAACSTPNTRKPTPMAT